MALTFCPCPAKRWTVDGNEALCSKCFRRRNPLPNKCSQCGRERKKHGGVYLRVKEGHQLCQHCRGRDF